MKNSIKLLIILSVLGLTATSSMANSKKQIKAQQKECIQKAKATKKQKQTQCKKEPKANRKSCKTDLTNEFKASTKQCKDTAKKQKAELKQKSKKTPFLKGKKVIDHKSKTKNKKPVTKATKYKKESTLAKKAFLAEINKYRTADNSCGGKSMPKKSAFVWDDKLFDAAIRHSKDMAKTGKLSHTGSDGSSAFDRISDTGFFTLGMRAENVAAGNSNIASVMKSWMKSTGHCNNIKTGMVRKVAVSMVENPNSSYKYYWTMTLAK